MKLRKGSSEEGSGDVKLISTEFRFPGSGLGVGSKTKAQLKAV